MGDMAALGQVRPCGNGRMTASRGALVAHDWFVMGPSVVTAALGVNIVYRLRRRVRTLDCLPVGRGVMLAAGDLACCKLG